MRKVPPGVWMVSFALAAERPMERTARLATKRPVPRSAARPTNRAIIIHIKNFDVDALPLDPAAPFAIAQLSQAGTVRPPSIFAELPSGSVPKPTRCAVNVPVRGCRSGFGRYRLAETNLDVRPLLEVHGVDKAHLAIVERKNHR